MGLASALFKTAPGSYLPHSMSTRDSASLSGLGSGTAAVSRPSDRAWLRAWLLALLVIGRGAPAGGPGRQSFWYDEAVSVVLARQSRWPTC